MNFVSVITFFREKKHVDVPHTRSFLFIILNTIHQVHLGATIGDLKVAPGCFQKTLTLFFREYELFTLSQTLFWNTKKLFI